MRGADVGGGGVIWQQDFGSALFGSISTATNPTDRRIFTLIAAMQRCGDATMKVWLDMLEVPKSRGFRAHEIGGIVALVEQHQAQFQEAWDEHFS